VVAHEADPVAVAERGHAVVVARCRAPVDHRIARPADAEVLEPLRQQQELESRGLVPGEVQGSVAAVPGLPALRSGAT
jgi:hypothetical protein